MNFETKKYLMKKVMWTSAFLAFLAGYHHADAQEAPHFDVVVMGKSWHFGNNVPQGYRGYNFNDYNPGVGLEYRYPGGFFVGALTYHDSYRNQAYAGYVGYQLTHHVSSDWSVFAALRAGYLNGSGFHGAMAMPTVGVQYKRLAVELEVIPKVADHGVNEVGVFGRWEF